jgi:histone H1/5
MHRFVETQYKLDIGAAQTTQLSKALSSGAEKGIFTFPKGMLIKVREESAE